jgi:hypothetical protein
LLLSLLPTNMKKLISLLLISFGLQAQLSEQAQVSLITIAPGKDLYAVFGHSSIWIQDPINGIDKVYSYGTFDFDTEHFYWKFLKGTLPYTISFNSMQTILDYYGQVEHRTVMMQNLRLGLAEKNKLYQALETNLLPENREYSYKFFYDNCATRIRDQVESVSSKAYDWDNYDRLQKKSYRDWMNQYLVANSWAALGMNLALGIPANHTATASNACYLPDNFYAATLLAKRNGQALADEPMALYASTEVSKASFDWFGPFTWLSILTFISLVVSFASMRLQYRFDVVLFSLYGILGIFLFFLAVGTDHVVMGWNPASLVLFPLQFPLVFWFAKSPAWRKYNLTMAVLAVIGFVWCLTESWTLLFPLSPVLVRIIHLAIRPSNVTNGY